MPAPKGPAMPVPAVVEEAPIMPSVPDAPPVSEDVEAVAQAAVLPLPLEMPPPPISKVEFGPKPSASNVEVKAVKHGVEVIALRAGFFQQSRKVEGDRFVIPSPDRIGDWMKFADPKLEAKRQADIKAKKLAEANKLAGK